jgi:putative transposase
VCWIDALSRPAYKDIVVKSLNYCIAEKGLQVHAWVIMSNHLHLIVSARPSYIISDIVRDFKKYTSRALINEITGNTQESRREWMLKMFAYAGQHNRSNEQYQFWQQDYHPVELNKEGVFKQKLNYIHENPFRAGLVWYGSRSIISTAVQGIIMNKSQACCRL